MRNCIKHNIYFAPAKKTQASEVAPLRCRVKWENEVQVFGVGYSVNIADWVKEAQRCKPRSYHGRQRISASTINATLEDVVAMVDSIFEFFEEQGIMPTRQQFKAVLDARTKKDENIVGLLLPVMDKYISDQSRSGQWRENTYKKVRNVKKHLQLLSANLTFDDLADDGMTKVVKHLLRLGVANVTIKKEVAVIKSFLRWAVEHDYTTNTKFLAARTHLSTVNKKVIYLDWDELMTVYEYDFSNNPKLAAVRDVFCFCAFTSLRYSDVANLRAEDVYDDYICVTTIKTSDTLRIELNKYSRAILAKYHDCEFDNGLVLPVISNQKSNKYLKDIGRICGLNSSIKMVTYKGAKRIEHTYQKWELLTTHAGRRTFVCNALMLGIPADIVMKWTGHSDYKAMKPYIAIADRAKKTAMSLFDNVPSREKGGTKF